MFALRLLHRCAPVAALGVALALPAWDAEAAPNNRLDRDVLPTAQSLRLKLDPSLPDYSGETHLDLQVVTSTTSFRLYAKDMDLIRVLLKGTSGELATKFEVGDQGQLTVTTDKPLPTGAYTLDIDFKNDFDQRANSLYRLKSGTDWYCYTQFEADAAREAFPCWDEPEFKIPFQVTVTVPAADAAVSNTPIEKEKTVGGLKTVDFARTPPLPSYLVAIAAGPFEFVPIPGMSVPGRVVTVKGSSRLAGEAVRATPPILGALEKYFGRPYPYAKLDLIAVPEFSAGAMENAGAVTYREEGLLIDPASSSAQQRYRLASTTAHELAHMWFGDLVTMEWWDDIWLNESFASWMGDKVTQQVFPGYAVPVRQLGGTQGAMVTDARLSTRPIRQAVDAMGDLDRMFDALSYQKGQAVLGMIEDWLGPEVFRRGVLGYLKAHEWKNATATDLWQALSSASSKDVAPVASSFLDQAGVPLVSLELEAGGKVHLRQQRFLNQGVESPRPVLWKIPITLKVSDGRQEFTQRLLLDEAEKTVTLEKAGSPVWVHPNANERGYYRWSVPVPMRQAIATHASKGLEPRERVGFLYDLAALLDAGQTHGDEYLRTLALFADDPEPEVTSAMIAGLEKVNNAFVTPDLVGAYSLVVRNLLRPALTRVGLARAKGEPEPVTLLRPNLLNALGVYGLDPQVLGWARPTARRYLDHPDSVDASIAGTALNLAVRDGDGTLFDEVRQHFEAAKVPSERARFLTALGHFRSGPMVERALDYALTGPLRPQEILTIPRNMNENDAFRERTWNWLRSGYRTVARRVPPNTLSGLPSLAACCDTLRIDYAISFFSLPETNLPGTREQLAKVTDSIRDCVRLRQREGAATSACILELARARRVPAAGAASPGSAPGR